jgi:glycosyltransferase involved in cell wall biosynthesis
MAVSSTSPDLSIVVNNYNYGRYLREALDTAMAQMRVSDEIIVVDDGSTDESQNVLQAYADNPRVKTIIQQNQGQMSAVRTGMTAARGDVLVLLDSDDYYLDGYLERLRALYSDFPELDFVFSRAQPEGQDVEALAQMRGILDRMELPAGMVGTTRWAALMSYEFVGSPTSGLSLRKALADKILQLPLSVDSTRRLPDLARHLLGASEHEASKHGLTADGVIVRSASALGAAKYYDDRPGFVYRIHGENKFATLPIRGRWYVRRQGRRILVNAMSRAFSVNHEATAAELIEEIRGRRYGLRLRRRLRVRFEYCLAALRCRGGVVDKLHALAVAAGVL